MSHKFEIIVKEGNSHSKLTMESTTAIGITISNALTALPVGKIVEITVRRIR